MAGAVEIDSPQPMLHPTL